MMHQCLSLNVIVCLASIVQFGNGYRILGVFPCPSISHQVVFRGLAMELNKRGHELVVVTTDPVNDRNLVNYTEIDVSFVYDIWGSGLDLFASRGKTRWIDFLPGTDMNEKYGNVPDRILSHPEVKKLYAPNSNETFDLLMVETLYWPSIYPLATRFSVPMIGIATMAPTVTVHYEIGNPIFSHDMSIWETEFEAYELPSFWQRLKKLFDLFRFLYWYETSYMSRQRVIARKHFGNDIPDLNDLAKNVSLVFVNQKRPISYARPNLPKVIEIGGFHVSKKSTSMSEDLQDLLDGATEGFVYMSLGTNVKSKLIQKKTMERITAAFSRLPYKILWKFEDDILPGKPDNVHIMKWVPQQAVLAHPNLKVFVYQGGVQSTEEAVHHAVPLVGLPFAWDQDMQVMKMVSLGVAEKLEISELDADELFTAISTVATDPSYKRKMLNLRSLVNDLPHDPLEQAIWWTEHVIRHKGAPQLHSTSADKPWYIRQDVDIFAFITAGLITISCLTSIILYQLVKRIFCIQKTRQLDLKKSN